MKLDISFDPVELIPGLGETINLRLLKVTRLRNETRQTRAGGFLPEFGGL